MERGKNLSRRQFLVGSAAATSALMSRGAFGFDKQPDTLKVGLIGCGGRGTGAAIDHINGSDDSVIHALGDVFEDRLNGCAGRLENDLGDRYKVDNRKFVGFDAYKKVIDSGADLIILATPPGFRPEHIEAVIDAGKHLFTEKPVCVDGPGYRKVVAAADKATAQGLAIVAGTQRRHDQGYQAAMERIHGGELGDVVASYCYWNQGGLWMHQRKPEWSDMEWQLRNWLYFTWLSGDHIVEQHIHNIDVCNWAKGAHPVKAIGLGGREVRTSPSYGHIFDHFAIEFEYEDGSRMTSYCRQIDGTASRVSEHIVGTKGTSNANSWIRGENAWRYDGPRENPYVLEHRDLVASIRAGQPLNEGRQVAESCMTAILGREATYTGQELTWEAVAGSDAHLGPDVLAWGDIPVPDVAVPGKTTIAGK